jgi:hypothetical protein
MLLVFMQGAYEQINHAQFNSPPLQVIQVQPTSLYFEHPQDITPLTIGDFTTQAIPFQFSQNNILGCGDKCLFLGLIYDNL